MCWWDACHHVSTNLALAHTPHNPVPTLRYASRLTSNLSMHLVTACCLVPRIQLTTVAYLSTLTVRVQAVTMPIAPTRALLPGAGTGSESWLIPRINPSFTHSSPLARSFIMASSCHGGCSSTYRYHGYGI